MKQKLPARTKWFGATQKPSRPGLYEVRRAVADGFPSHSMLMWDGCRWLHTEHSGGGWLRAGCTASMNPSDRDVWRGLVSPAEAA
jgi:hypothetical protein